MNGFAPALVAILLIASCGTSPSAPPPVNVASPFTLAPGQTVLVEGTPLRVTFDRVGSDSRCPADVTCVWEGDAVVLVSVRTTDPAPASHELHTAGRYPGEVEAGAYLLRLVGLAPVPRQDKPTGPADYRATLVVNPK